MKQFNFHTGIAIFAPLEKYVVQCKNCFALVIFGRILENGCSGIVRSQPPGVGVKSIFCPVLGSKLKPCLCVPKQTHRPQVCHLGDGHQRSSTVDFSTFNDHRLSRRVQGAQDSLSFVIHFVSACNAARASE